jgi:hypothetical protein
LKCAEPGEELAQDHGRPPPHEDLAGDGDRQNWPNPGLMPRSLVRSRDGHKIKI